MVPQHEKIEALIIYRLAGWYASGLFLAVLERNSHVVADPSTSVLVMAVRYQIRRTYKIAEYISVSFGANYLFE
jgi:hypothetical protein